jgi:predicted phosphodiesterase
MSRYRCFVSI